MLLRKNKHYRGFYKDFHEGLAQNLISVTKKRETKSLNPAFKSELKAIKNLRNS